MRQLLIFISIIFLNCDEDKESKRTPNLIIQKESKVIRISKKIKNIKEKIVLSTDSAIPFFYKYGKSHKENKVRMVIREYGSIDILLYDNTPYHRANFIYLASKHYFDGTCFHRVVGKFIIQGGGSDTYKVRDKRILIGRYLLPPDTKKGYKHHRGTISMPSSDIDNPYQMASPYEFFIVVQKPGAYHLDGKYTAFGRVIKGMDVVDKINKVETDNRDWPKDDVIIETVKILK